MKNQNGKKKLIAYGYVYIVQAKTPMSCRTIGVYDCEETARERIRELRECFVIKDYEIATINPEEVWGWEE